MHETPAVRAPEFPLGLDWFNTDSAIALADFRGRFVVVEFWTSC